LIVLQKLIEQQEEMKQNKRLLDRAARKIERERGKLDA
jgi:hypothetical protein